MLGDSQMHQLYNTIVAATTNQKEALGDKKDIRDEQNYTRYHLPKCFDNFEDDIDSLVAAGRVFDVGPRQTGGSAFEHGFVRGGQLFHESVKVTINGIIIVIGVVFVGACMIHFAEILTLWSHGRRSRGHGKNQ